ncbi:unnamed protein product [Owenia fusiformis]|uniref:Uncharacterized protein n=1 Tax=Owenia fusiformis TaxID=6347 RepID=A0A8J1UB25_OWEFU|nr:unnamed protein product [Owenia fusiformis]
MYRQDQQSRSNHGYVENIPMSHVDHRYVDAHQVDVNMSTMMPTRDNSDLRLRRQHSDAPSYHSSGDDADFRHNQPHTGGGLIDELPSRQLINAVNQIEDSKTWKKKSSKAKKYATLHLRRGQQAVNFEEAMIENIGSDPENEADAEMVEAQTIEALRAMTIPIARKRAMIDKKRDSNKTKRFKKVGFVKRTKYSMSIGWSHFKQQLAEVRYTMELWYNHLKKIEGHFGTGVTSYFLFLKWMFLMNMPVFLLVFGFIVIPQIIWRYQQSPIYTGTFTGVELMTGWGFFENTEMFYGYYVNDTISGRATPDLKYDMKYAYLLTMGAYYLLIMIILMGSLTRSYRKNYIDGGGEFSLYFSSKVFCGWDYGMTARDAAKLKQKSISQELKEFLASRRKRQEPETCGIFCSNFLLRLVTNVIVLGLLGGSGYLVWFLATTQSLKTDLAWISDMAMPLVISVINWFLPFAFSIIATFERYKKPKSELYITMLRTMMLNLVTIGVLVYYWFNNVSCARQAAEDQTEYNECYPCWESFMGQQLYRLVLVDFVFMLLLTFFSEFVRSLMSKYCCKRLGSPEFNIARNTLNLIYSQILIWLGTYYSPLLPFIQILKLFIVFYVKRVSVMMNCVPSIKPWRASKAHTIFLAIQFMAFILVAVAIGFSVGFIAPSSTCGPYRGYATTYDVIVDLINTWQGQYEILRTILNLITTPGFIAFVVVGLCLAVYYMRIVSVGHNEMVQLLKHQLALEGRDKIFLLRMLQEASGRGDDPSSRPDLSKQPQITSPGGKKFAKMQEKHHNSPLTRRKENNNGGIPTNIGPSGDDPNTTDYHLKEAGNYGGNEGERHIPRDLYVDTGAAGSALFTPPRDAPGGVSHGTLNLGYDDISPNSKPNLPYPAMHPGYNADPQMYARPPMDRGQHQSERKDGKKEKRKKKK